MPPRGYWAKKQTGKSIKQILLPPRKPGMDEDIRLGGSVYDYRRQLSDKVIKKQTFDPPVFDESMDDVRERIKDQLGDVPKPQSLRHAHPLITKLLEEDEQRRLKVANSKLSTCACFPIL
jgi:hypothetical protein